jgi:hypothetical protein
MDSILHEQKISLAFRNTNNTRHFKSSFTEKKNTFKEIYFRAVSQQFLGIQGHTADTHDKEREVYRGRV